jgi:hypothetical protein
LFKLFATCVVDTGSKFINSVVDISGNLPPVSPVPVTLTPVANLLPVSPTPVVQVANLPLVLLRPVVQLDLRISMQIFEKSLK